jgi:hypothetical protein
MSPEGGQGGHENENICQEGFRYDREKVFWFLLFWTAMYGRTK